jgi:hypothetical protein
VKPAASDLPSAAHGKGRSGHGVRERHFKKGLTRRVTIKAKFCMKNNQLNFDLGAGRDGFLLIFDNPVGFGD